MRGESPAPDDQRCPPQILDGCPLSFLFILSTATTADPRSPHAQVPVGGGDAFAPVAGGPGQFRSVQSAEEAGDLILGPAELEWNEQLGAGQPDNTDPLPENAAAPDATSATSPAVAARSSPRMCARAGNSPWLIAWALVMMALSCAWRKISSSSQV